MSENPSVIPPSPKPTGGLKKNVSRFGNIEPLEAIIRISSKVTKSSQFIHQFINELYKFLDCSLVAFYHLEVEDTLNLIEIETDLPQKASYLNTSISTKSEEPIAQAARLQETRFLSNFEDEENKYLQGVFHPETLSSLCIPVFINEKLFGVVDLQVSIEGKLTRSDSSYFSTIMKMFGIFLGDTLNKEKTNLPLEDLMKYFSTTSSLFSVKTLDQVKESLAAAFENSGFVMGLFSMEKNNLVLRSIIDPYGTSFDKTLIGLSTNFEKTLEKIQNKEMLFLTDLPSQTEFGDFLSFFIRRECQSLAIIPVRLNTYVKEVIVIGSRSSAPINKDQVGSYLEIINIYEKRLAYEQNLTLIKSQESLQELIENCTKKIIGSENADAMVNHVAKEILEVYEEDVDLYFTKNNSFNQKTIFDFVFQDGKKTEIDALPMSNDLGVYLGSIDEPKLVNNNDQEIALLEPVLKEKKPNSIVFLPVSRDGSFQQVFIITAVGDRELSESDFAAMKIISKMVSNKLAQFDNDATLAKISLQAQKNIELQRKLSEISKSLSDYKKHGDVLAALPRLLNMAGLARRIATFVPLAEGGLRLVGSAGLTDKQIETIADNDENIIQEAAKDLQPILIDNYLLENKQPVSIDSLSGITLPLVFEKNLYGVLNLEDKENSFFNTLDFELYQTLATNIGSVFSSIDLVGQIQHQVAQQELLFAATEKIRRSLDMESILKVSAEEIARLINAKEAKIEVKLEEDQASIDLDEGVSA